MPSRTTTLTLPNDDHWHSLAHHHRLSLLLDLDGTLVELAATPEDAMPREHTTRLLEALADVGVNVVIVSGRPRATVEPIVASCPRVRCFAEHAAWSCEGGTWSGPGDSTPELAPLVASLTAIAQTPGMRTERKSLSFCVHWRGVPEADRPAIIEAIELACDEWLETHTDFERLPGADHVEIRRRSVTKGDAVRVVREALPGTRIIAIGDDHTDEDMFALLDPDEASIVVGRRVRSSRASSALAGPAAVHAFLTWILHARQGAPRAVPPIVPILEWNRPARWDLVVVSNRMPAAPSGRERQVGGLVSALEPALRDRAGIWLGWSGQDREGKLHLDIDAETSRASFDLPRSWHDHFYAGFCNRVLWPLFHSFPMRVVYEDADWAAYVAANAAYAEQVLALARPDATIWVHDYHLLLVARELRRRGFAGRIGLFLHIPFPPRELLATMPWADELIDAMREFDLVGFHTAQWQQNFVEALGDGAACRTGVFPIPIESAPFREVRPEAPDVSGLRSALGERMLILGVDRLDYAKGIPQRLAGYERLLERYPAWRSRVSLVQVSVPSRAEIADYRALREEIETIVGRINGAYGEADWVPVRYLYRSYDHAVLAQLYRLARVALVTPLRDGMNLVAKEFVASQDAADPGVLVLSRFAGAAAQLGDAVLTNPFHPDGLARDLDRALAMPEPERRARHDRLRAVVEAEHPTRWAAAFLEALEDRANRTGTGTGRDSTRVAAARV